MDEREKASRGLWSFPEGTLGPDDRVKGFRVEASDGHAGKVSCPLSVGVCGGIRFD